MKQARWKMIFLLGKSIKQRAKSADPLHILVTLKGKGTKTALQKSLHLTILNCPKCRTVKKQNSFSTRSLHTFSENSWRDEYTVLSTTVKLPSKHPLKCDRTHWNQDAWDSIHYIQLSVDWSQHWITSDQFPFVCFFYYMCGSFSASLLMSEEVVYQLRDALSSVCTCRAGGSYTCCTYSTHHRHRSSPCVSPELQRASPE